MRTMNAIHTESHDDCGRLFEAEVRRDTEEMIVENLSRLYVSNRQRFVMMMPDGKIFIAKNGDKTRYLKDSYLHGHAARKFAIGIFAGKYASKFLCFDVDTPDEALVSVLLRELEVLGVPQDM